MNILFSSEEVIDICNGKYYSMNLGQHLLKYKYIGDITCVCYCRTVEKTELPEIDKSSAKFVFTKKETNPFSKHITSIHNHAIIEECTNDCDAVVAHVPSWNSHHSISIAKQQNKPVMVVAVGCIWDSMWNYDWRGKLLALPEFIREKHQIASSKYTLYVTEHFLQKRYPCHGVTEHASNVCISIVPNDVLLERLAKIDSYTSRTPINIVTTAAVNVRYKGQEYVIRALAKLNKELGFNYHYHLIGGGDQSFLKSVAKNEGVEQFVHFLGPLPHDKVTETLDKMDIYIQPSKQEGLPRALIEGMSRALPAVGSRVAGIPELLSDDFLVKKGSVKDIIKVLSTMIDKESLKQQARTNFQKASEYTVDIINTRRQAFFDKFIKEIEHK